jgi:hypothetical protein
MDRANIGRVQRTKLDKNTGFPVVLALFGPKVDTQPLRLGVAKNGCGQAEN